MTAVAGDEMVCIELVELVTDYFEDALSEADRLRFEAHIAACGPCVRYLEQLRMTIELSGRLDEGDLQPEMREVLLETFRGWRTPSV